MAGYILGLLLRGIQKDQIERGRILAKPNTILSYTIFESEVYILIKAEEGLSIIFVGYHPHFFI